MKSVSLPELTLRGCVIATLITIVFTAANVYLALKVGLTFATSIPSAIIAMGLLRFFRNGNILENCTVQTFASSAGTLTSIVFVLPALVMLGYWSDFPYWQTASLCAMGGILGVMFTIPLRRALVVDSQLPYPEGVAAAKILALGDTSVVAEEHLPHTGAKDIWHGALLSALFTLFSNGFNFLAETFKFFFSAGGAVYGVAMQYSLALLGAGYLIGIRIGLAILIGIIINWVIAIPYFAATQGIPADMALADVAFKLWADKARYIAVGTLAIASIWTILALLPALAQAVRSSLQDMQQAKKAHEHILPRTERDLPINYVLIVSLLLIVPTGLLFYYFIDHAHLGMSHTSTMLLVVICTLFVVALGFIVSAVSGYMAGVVGSSCSPMSGICVIGVLCAVLLVAFLARSLAPEVDFEHLAKPLMALGIFMASYVMSTACISNDNLQDLKTGQLVGATPWRQQMALILGVLVGALVIPLVITLVHQAYGFVGADLPRPGMDPEAVLSAPQAMLMTELARGIILRLSQWNLLGIGAALGLVLILFDLLVLKARRLPRLSVLAVGMGLYLPIHISLTIVVGTLVSHLIKRKLRKQHGQDMAVIANKEQRGTSFAAGMLLGETLLGIAFAAIIVTTGNSHPLSLVGPGFAMIASVLGFVGFVLICWRFYHYVVR